MGRAIVREPAAFLMDEPLSNLDAKLRVQMRAEIAGLQRDLGVTTIYVTHDQVEAMTMGDRVAVMRKGELQQVADPQTLYDRPVNLFVGGFIGSPAMNMVEATLEQQNGGYVAKLGDAAARAVAGDASGAARRLAALRGPHGRSSASAPRISRTPSSRPTRRPIAGCAARRRADARRSARRSWCTSRSRRSPPSPRTCASSPRTSATIVRSASWTDEDQATFVGRFGARSTCTCRAGARGRGRHPQPPFLRSRLWPRDLRRDSDERSSTVKKHHVIGAAIVAMVLPLVLIGAAAGRSAKSGAAASGSARAAGVSGTVTFDGVWTGSEAASFGKVIKAFNKVYPNVKIKYNPLGNNVSTVLSTSIAGGHPPDMADIAQPGYVKQLVQQGHLKPITYASRRDRGELLAGLAVARHLQRQALRARLQGLEQVAALVQRARFQGGGREAAEDVGAADRGVAQPARLGHAGLLDRRRGRLDAHRPVREHLPADVRPGHLPEADHARHQVDRPDGDHGAEGDGPDHRRRARTWPVGRAGALQYGFNDSVTNAFGSPPKAAMVFEGDFVSGVIQSSTKSKAGSGYEVTPFPTIKPGPGATGVEVGGDLFVTFNDTPAVEAFVKFLATRLPRTPGRRTAVSRRATTT